MQVVLPTVHPHTGLELYDGYCFSTEKGRHGWENVVTTLPHAHRLPEGVSLAVYLVARG